MAAVIDRHMNEALRKKKVERPTTTIHHLLKLAMRRLLLAQSVAFLHEIYNLSITTQRPNSLHLTHSYLCHNVS